MKRRAHLILLAIVVAALAACGGNDTKLKVTGLDPDHGDVEGGSYVRIKGNRFIADGARNAKVFFGSRQGTVVRFANDNELIVEAPGGKDGEVVDVLIIFEPGGEVKLPHAFTFTDKAGQQQMKIDDLDTKKAK